MESAVAVTGEILLEEGTPRGRGRIVVVVEDVTRADALARTVASETIDLPAVRGDVVPFRVEVTGVDPAASYALRVHVDCDGDGELGPGDFTNTQAYPVLTRGAPVHVRVRVTKV